MIGLGEDLMVEALAELNFDLEEVKRYIGDGDRYRALRMIRSIKARVRLLPPDDDLLPIDMAADELVGPATGLPSMVL